MRTALVLLLLLAIAAVPGSILPQRGIDAGTGRGLPRPSTRTARAVARPARLLRRLRLAVVLRDLPAAVRLAGRLRRAAVAGSTGTPCAPQPPRAPRRLERLPEHAELAGATAPVDEALAAAAGGAAGRRYRVARARRRGPHALSAESGYLRETGNLRLPPRADRASSSASRSGTCSAGAATSSCPWARRSPTRCSAYDTLRPRAAGSTPETLPPFSVTVDELDVTLRGAGRRRAVRRAPRLHGARDDDRAARAEPERQQTLTGQPPAARSAARRSSCSATATPRWSPSATRGAASLYRGATPFLPQDNNYTVRRRDQGAGRPSRSSSASPGSSCRPPSSTYADGPHVAVPGPEEPGAGAVGLGGRPLPRRPARSRSTRSTPTDLQPAHQGRRQAAADPAVARARPSSCPAAAGSITFDGPSAAPGCRSGTTRARLIALVGGAGRARRSDRLADRPPPAGLRAGASRRRPRGGPGDDPAARRTVVTIGGLAKGDGRRAAARRSRTSCAPIAGHDDG